LLQIHVQLEYVHLVNRRRIMKSNEELFVFLEKLETNLRDIGDFDAADRLVAAVHISSVGTEVFMSIRSELMNIMNSQTDLDPETTNEVRDAVREINKALSV